MRSPESVSQQERCFVGMLIHSGAKVLSCSHMRFLIAQASQPDYGWACHPDTGHVCQFTLSSAPRTTHHHRLFFSFIVKMRVLRVVARINQINNKEAFNKEHKIYSTLNFLLLKQLVFIYYRAILSGIIEKQLTNNTCRYLKYTTW